MNSQNPLEEAPFVWPGAPGAGEGEPGDLARWLREMGASADRVFGLVSGLSDGGVQLIREISARQGVRLQLLVVLQPACATTTEHLRSLLEIQASAAGRLEFRLMPADTLLYPASTVLAFLEPQSTRGYLALGPTPILGSLRPEAGHVNVVLEAAPLLFDAWRTWFDAAWPTSTPLDASTAEIPKLVPATGTPEGAALWAAYMARCRAARAKRVGTDRASVDPTTGEVRVVGPDGRPKPTASETLGLPKLDTFDREVCRLFARGQTASIANGTRMRPLHVPIPAEWFGVERSRQVGWMQQETSFRISAFDEKTSKLVNEHRSMTRILLDKLSFSIGKGVRWMPASAVPLFEKEMERADMGAREFLKQLVKDGPKAFVAVNRQRVANDAQAMYAAVNRGRQLPPHILDRILAALETRLRDAQDGHLLPQVVYRPAQFTAEPPSQWHAHWADAISLLADIAELPRVALSETGYWKHLDVEREEWREALDVLGDPFFDLSPGGRNIARARAELQLIRAIAKSEAADRDRCQLLYSFTRGAVSAESAAAALAEMEKAAQDAQAT